MKKNILIIAALIVAGALVYALSGSTERTGPRTTNVPANEETASTTPDETPSNEKVMEDGTSEPLNPIEDGTLVEGELELPREIEITYSDQGFNPIIAIVEQGATVKFINTSKLPLWVASDPHPSHTAYSAFDSKIAVPPGAAYSFTFTKIGSWKYHNHQNAGHTGTINVE